MLCNTSQCNDNGELCNSTSSTYPCNQIINQNNNSEDFVYEHYGLQIIQETSITKFLN